MLKRMDMGAFLGIVRATVEERTGVSCYTNPDGEESPFYSVQLLKTESLNTKTMYIDRYDIWIHCIAAPVVPHSDAPVLDLAQLVQEALTEDLALMEPFEINNQQYNGLQSVKCDESGEGHAVLSFYFDVCYGLRVK